jgi:hypothetical protein
VLRLAIYGFLAAAIKAGHEDTVTKVILLIATLLPSSFAITDTLHMKPLTKTAVQSGNLRMMVPLRMLSNEVKFSPKLLRMVCRTDSATLIQDMINVGIFDKQANRGLLRHAIRTGSVAVAKVLLSLTLEPKHADNLIHLAIESGNTAILKLLLKHKLRIKPSHCLHAEATLKSMGYDTTYYHIPANQIYYSLRYPGYPRESMSTLLTPKVKMWGPQDWRGVRHRESIASYEYRRNRILMALLVHRLAKEAESVAVLEWDTPLLDKLEVEVDGDEYWRKEVGGMIRG